MSVADTVVALDGKLYGISKIDEQGEVVWAYVNAYDENFVGEITNSDIFPTDFFETDFSECN